MFLPAEVGRSEFLARFCRHSAGGPNARFIWGVQKFDITPEITANTKSIDLGFKLTKGMIVNFNNAGLPECNNKCVEGVNLMSFAFTVDVN